MSKSVFQPVGQKRLTNVAVVRYKKGGIRFEIACYPNKVVNWRHGIEKDLDEVLQSETVFTNVSKGILAKDKELERVFGTTVQRDVCLLILEKGDLQVSEKERKLEYSNLFKDVCTILAEKCVDPTTSRPYTLTMIEKALRDCHFSVDPKRSAKQQALEAVPQLKASGLPIERARMRLKVVLPVGVADGRGMLEEVGAAVEFEDTEPDGATTLVVTLEPGQFRKVHTVVAQKSSSRGRVEVLALAVQADAASADEFASGAQQRTAFSGASTAPRASSTAAAGPRSAMPAARASRAPSGDVVYERGPIAGIPDKYESRREMFVAIDSIQAGWTVELLARGDGSTADAVFYSPGGERVGAFAAARRAALAAKKAGEATSGVPPAAPQPAAAPAPVAAVAAVTEELDDFLI